MEKFVASIETSGQITEDRWRVIRHHLEVTEATTIGEIIEWAKKINFTNTAIEITELQTLTT